MFGIDISRDNIENRLKGACARYLNYRKQFKRMPSALFVAGNTSVNIRDTEALFTDKGKQITNAVFGKAQKTQWNLGKGYTNNMVLAKVDSMSVLFSLLSTICLRTQTRSTVLSEMPVRQLRLVDTCVALATMVSVCPDVAGQEGRRECHANGRRY